MPPKHTNPFCFLITLRGKPFSKESFGNWFKKACVAAGRPHCTAHGLRKATLRRMAELQMSNKTMKSVSGQRSDKTLAKYIKRPRRPGSPIRPLGNWPLGNARSEAMKQAILRSEERCECITPFRGDTLGVRYPQCFRHF